jgi:hypothetical protein
LQRFSLTHTVHLTGLVPGTAYEAVMHSRDVDDQETVSDPLPFTTTALRPAVVSFNPPALTRARANAFVEVTGLNLFPGVFAEFVMADPVGDEPPAPDPSVEIVAMALGSDTTLELGVATAANAPPGRRRLHVVNTDGFETFSDVTFGIVPPGDAVDTDRSGRVDGFDLARLARGFGASFPQPAYDPGVDFDADADVDGVDLAHLADAFGRLPLP